MNANLLQRLLDEYLSTTEQATVHLQSTLQILQNSEVYSSASAASQHKFLLKITSLCKSTHNAGFQMANLFLSRDEWDQVWIKEIKVWFNHVLSTLPRCTTCPQNTYVAALMLLQTILKRSPASPEFHREVIQPILPKLTPLLLDALSHVTSQQFLVDNILKTIILKVRLYSTASRTSANKVYVACMQLLTFDEHSGKSTQKLAAEAISVLHLCSGKAAAPDVWRTDCTTLIYGAHAALDYAISFFPGPSAAQASIPFNSHLTLSVQPRTHDAAVRQLAGCVRAIIGLVSQSQSPRPCPVPIGELIQLCLRMLRVDRRYTSSHGSNDILLIARQFETVPYLRTLACALLAALAELSGNHLSPELQEIYSVLSDVLEDNEPTSMTSVLILLPQLLKRLPSIPAPKQLAHSYDSHALMTASCLRVLVTLFPKSPKSTADSTMLQEKKKDKKGTGLISNEAADDQDDSPLIVAALRALPHLIIDSALHRNSPLVALSHKTLINLQLNLRPGLSTKYLDCITQAIQICCSGSSSNSSALMSWVVGSQNIALGLRPNLPDMTLKKDRRHMEGEDISRREIDVIHKALSIPPVTTMIDPDEELARVEEDTTTDPSIYPIPLTAVSVAPKIEASKVESVLSIPSDRSEIQEICDTQAEEPPAKRKREDSPVRAPETNLSNVWKISDDHLTSHVSSVHYAEEEGEDSDGPLLEIVVDSDVSEE